MFQQERSVVIEGLPSVEDPAGNFFQTQSAGAATIDFDAIEQQQQSGTSDEEEEDGEGSDAGAHGACTSGGQRGVCGVARRGCNQLAEARARTRPLPCPLLQRT